MNAEIIKQQLIEQIKDRKVLAAAFYTFNFQPDFFENYVLPVLVPKVEFKNSRLYNAIMWRRVLLPPTVVYFDDGIQKMPDSQAPLQDYEICPVRMNPFFHPKANFILVENEDGTKGLLVLMGSNNLTRAGWCENLEATMLFEIEAVTSISLDFIQSLIHFIEQNKANFGIKGVVERQLIDFLKSVKLNQETAKIKLYQSWQQTFEAFLKQHIFEKDVIEYVEILSPFFQKKIKEQTPLTRLKKYIEVPIHCLIPLKHGAEIQLEQEVFEDYENNGVTWCNYQTKDKLLQSFSDRYNHSKIYRFKGQKANYTVIGSVNFTTNAWQNKAKGGNVETAVLVEETDPFHHLITPVSFNPNWQFLQNDEQQEAEIETFFRKAPPFKFTLNWEERTLIFEPLETVLTDAFKLEVEGLLKPLKHKETFVLTKIAHQTLADNPMIKVLEITPEKTYEHFYYPHQIGIALRPFQVKFPFKDLQELWKLLNHETVDEAVYRIMERLVDQYEKADGSVDTDLVQEGIINKMAAHIDTLVGLEQSLLKPNMTKERLEAILVQDVFGSVPYYKRVCILEDDDLNKGFAWVLLNILKKQFYTPKKHPIWEALQPTLAPIIRRLDEDITQMALDTKIDNAHLEWALKIL